MTDTALNEHRTEMQALSAEAAENLKAGDLPGVRRLCEQMLAREPAYSHAHMLMARAMMPGDNYGQILSKLHQHLQPATYVEIGVATGESMSYAQAQTRAVGIDPELRISRPISARARLYPVTSDDFFARYDLFEELGERSMNLAFIDGLHLFEQALRDFINVERYAQDNSVVAVHDCFPPTELSAARERKMAYWCGDVWRLIPCLKKYRPDLNIAVIPAPPSGLAIITGLDPGSTVLADNFDRYVEESLAIPYTAIDENRQLLCPVANDWSQICASLPR
jgi:predicted O-methyltransferase YrrM